MLIYCLLISLTCLSSSAGSFNLIQLEIAMTLLICRFDNLCVYIRLKIFTSLLFALQVVAIEAVVAVVNVTAK